VDRILELAALLRSFRADVQPLVQLDRHRSHKEQIFYGECHGRRPKRVLVKVIGE
jgi:hypothetical protein